MDAVSNPVPDPDPDQTHPYKYEYVFVFLHSRQATYRGNDFVT